MSDRAWEAVAVVALIAYLAQIAWSSFRDDNLLGFLAGTLGVLLSLVGIVRRLMARRTSHEDGPGG